MKLALISDTHSYLPEMPSDVDAVIHAGDIGPDRDPINWFRDVLYPWAERVKVPIFATFGNHDFIGQRHAVPVGQPDNLHFIVDQAHTINGVKFWFSPWSNLFGAWAYMLPEDGLAARYAKIDADTEVIVSHGPPKFYGDKILWDGRIQNVGSVSLAQRAEQLPKLRYIITGHIHEAHGSYLMRTVRVLNVSHVNEMYRPTHAPTILDVTEADPVGSHGNSPLSEAGGSAPAIRCGGGAEAFTGSSTRTTESPGGGGGAGQTVSTKEGVDDSGNHKAISAGA